MSLAARIDRGKRLRQAALVRGHLERLEMFAKGTHILWQMRWAERRTEEGRLKLAALRNIRTLFKGFGETRELARLARRFWAKADVMDKPSAVAALKSIMLQRTEDLRAKLAKDTAEVLRDTVDQAAESTRLILLQQKSSAELRRVQKPIAVPIAKQIEFLAPRLHEDMSNDLVNSVIESLERSFEGYGGDLANTIVDASNPNRPLTMAQLSAELENDFLGISAKRANMIARTESARVYGEVSLNEMRKLGIKERRWLTAAGSPSANISPVCPYCISLANKGWTSVNESITASLSVGIRNPSDVDIESAHPPFHPNCRCDIQANVDGWFPESGFEGLDGLPSDLALNPSELPTFDLPKTFRLRNEWRGLWGELGPTVKETRELSAFLARNPTMYDPTNQRHRVAVHFLNEMKVGAKFAELHRGMKMTNVAADELLGVWTRGATIELDGATAFGKRFSTSLQYSTPEIAQAANNTAFRITVRGAQGFDLGAARAGGDFAGLEEVLTTGRFRVVSVKTSFYKLPEGAKVIKGYTAADYRYRIVEVVLEAI